MENQTNIILIDWLTVTSKADSVDSFMTLLGMDKHGLGWEDKEAWMMGYRYRKTWGGVTILYGGHDDAMGVCLTMSGTGCRTFESHSDVTWLQLLAAFVDDPQTYNITRLDLAYDDHTGVLDINRLIDDTEDKCYRAKSRWWMIQNGSEGTCIYHGSPRSNIRTRIYDKAAERGLDDGSHWIRVELQLRQENAFAAVLSIIDDMDVGRTMRGVLSNYLNYLEPSGEDSNKSRWPLAGYWRELLEDIQGIRLWADPGTEYNILRTERFLVAQCGPSILTYSEIYGLDHLLELIHDNGTPLSPKYQRMISEAGPRPDSSSEHIIRELRSTIYRLEGDIWELKQQLRDKSRKLVEKLDEDPHYLCAECPANDELGGCLGGELCEEARFDCVCDTDYYES